MSNKYKVAVVGATGAVGEVMLSILAERKFPISELVALASERSAGSHIDFGDDEVLVQDLANFDPSSVDIALFSAGGATSKEYAPKFAAAGAVVIDNGDLSGRYARIGRHELNRTGTLADPQALAIYSASRPFMEFHVRRRVDSLTNVAFLDGHDAIEPVHDRGVVRGVRVTNRDNKLTQVLRADLVIDATGRASRTAEFLAGHGFGCVPDHRLRPAWAYSSQLLRIPPGRLDDQMVFVNQGRAYPGLLLVAYEHDTWMLSIARHGDYGSPPRNFTAMQVAARQLLPASIMAGLHDATPVGDIAVSHDTGALWHRYHQMPRFPEGLVVIGDGLCRLNPLHGQGMTVAALQALALRDCLAAGGPDLSQRFFRAAAAQIGPVWYAQLQFQEFVLRL